jgi:hypothetical protein
VRKDRQCNIQNISFSFLAIAILRLMASDNNFGILKLLYVNQTLEYNGDMCFIFIYDVLTASISVMVGVIASSTSKKTE